jgi:RimJ/RimL family protein N-acetyltransferase
MDRRFRSKARRHGEGRLNIPATRISEASRLELTRHFLALGPEDVRLRFGSMLSALAIEEYVARIDFASDAVFGVHDDALALVGVAHVGIAEDLAELGISVLAGHRGRGIGGTLLARASEHARNRFIDRLYMHCLAENTAMMRLARKLEMQICVDAGEADAFLKLPPANPASVTGEFVEQRLALFDYALKAQVAPLRQIAATLRETERGKP